MHENEITDKIINCAIKVHKLLGPGLLESVYEKVLAYEMKKHNLHVEIQKSIPIKYEDIVFEQGFRADLVVDDKVIIELKSVKNLEPVHAKQLLTYLRLTNKKLGLLLNFNEVLLKDGIKRVINGYI